MEPSAALYEDPPPVRLTYGRDAFHRVLDFAQNEWNSLQVALLVGLVLLVQTVLARWLTPRLRYALSLLFLLRLLLPAVPSSPLSLQNLFPPPMRLGARSRG
jgi:hypothetical protein